MVASRRPPRLVFLVSLGAAAAGAALLAWLLFRDTGPSAGPLHQLEVTSVAIPQTTGVSFGFGLPVAVNGGEEPAVLTRIAPVAPTPGLYVVNAYVGGPDRRYLWYGTSYRWPSRDRFSDLHPVRGFAVAPESEPTGKRGAELVFVLRADRPGRYTFTAVSVEYRVGDTEHRALLHNGLRACVVARGKRRPRCPPPRDL